MDGDREAPGQHGQLAVHLREEVVRHRWSQRRGRRGGRTLGWPRLKASTDRAIAVAAATEIGDLAVTIIRHARRPRCLPPQDTRDERRTLTLS